MRFRPALGKRLYITGRTGAKHSADVGVSFVEAFVYDGVYEGAAVKEHSLIGTGAGISAGVFLPDFLLPVIVALPESTISDLLYFDDVITVEQSSYWERG